MTKCEYCQEHFWNKGQTSCSGGMCSSAYEMMRDEGLLEDEDEEQEPLSAEDFESMAGKPVYCPSEDLYGIVKYETSGRWAGIPFLVGAWHNKELGVAVNFEWNIQERNLKCYRIEQEDEE